MTQGHMKKPLELLRRHKKQGKNMDKTLYSDFYGRNGLDKVNTLGLTALNSIFGLWALEVVPNSLISDPCII